MFLVLIETSGNQNFIFATNKLKENIGASELTYRVGTQWLLEIIGDINQNPSLKIWQDNDYLRKLLLSELHNPPIDNENSGKPVEIIIAVSGKALLLTQTEDIAKNIITKLSQKALKDAPGIDICGVYEEFSWNDPIEKAIKAVYRKFEEVHSRIPTPNFRFLRLPIVASCETSGLPASGIEINPEKEKIPVSQVSLTKRQQGKNFLTRIQKIVLENKLKFPENTNDLEKEFEDNLQWLGIVHADGNGLGQIFLNFEQFINGNTKEEKNRDYINKLRKFSLALDLCTENAFKTALSVFDGKTKRKIEILPIVPLVLGGDDLTVICDGKNALEFTRKFLLEFEAETAREDLPDVGSIIADIAQKALGSKGLSACAGIAIVKPHFPFSVGYELAESLLKSAKTVKNNVKDSEDKTVSCSALDFHIVYDSSGIDLDLIRKRLELKNGDNTTIKLYKRPFIVTPLNQLEKATESSKLWAEFYHWDKFKEKVDLLTINPEELTNNDQQKKSLPPNQSNNLRSALFRGKEAGDAEFGLICHRYDNTEKLAESTGSLLTTIPGNSQIYTTGFIDALDAVEFV